MLIESKSTVCFPTNSVLATQAQPVLPTLFAGPVPSGDGVVALGHLGGYGPAALKIIPFGQGADGQNFTINVYGWHILPGGIPLNNTGNLWLPVWLATFTATLDALLAGPQGSEYGPNSLWCRAITLTSGIPGCYATSPGKGLLAHCYIPSQGARFMEVRFATGGLVTGCNALASPI